MPLLIPQYIERAKVDDVNVRFEWDDWNVHKADRPSDPIIVATTGKLWDRANIAFTVACAEWVVYRFRTLYDDMLPLDYIEALWAWNVDWRYSIHFQPIDQEWLGPVLGPIELAILIANDAFENSAEQSSTAVDPSWMGNLAQHVLHDKDPFLNWRAAILPRLEMYYEKPEEGELLDGDQEPGPFVPREAFDPEFGFHPRMTDELIAKFIAQLDYTVNPFLRPPQEMRKLGFEGEPYKWPKTLLQENGPPDD